QRLSAGDVAGKMSDEIAYVAADPFARVVDRHGRAQFFHLAFYAPGDVTLFARETVDLDELDEQIFQPCLIDQTNTSFLRLGGLSGNRCRLSFCTQSATGARLNPRENSTRKIRRKKLTERARRQIKPGRFPAV